MIDFNKSVSRRSAIIGTAAAIAGGSLIRDALADAPATAHAPDTAPAPAKGDTAYLPVITPNGSTMPWRLVDGVKVGHLIAGEFEHEFSPGLTARCWGYNGQTPGPTIEAVDGDHLRIYVTNTLPAPTTVHWHGLLLPMGMDGVAGLTQKPIMPGETFRYEFTLRQHGTCAYHSHFDDMTQLAMGMMGLFVIHPKQRPAPAVDRDFAIMLSEWRIIPGTRRPDPNEMTDFNILTLNSRCFPGTDPLVVRQGQRVRIRLANFGAMDHHPIHLHGNFFNVTETDGFPVPLPQQRTGNTVLVPVGSTRAIEFVANEPGDWAMHCHMSHHAMNQMGHGNPNVLGAGMAGFNQRVRPLLDGYMAMGQSGMGGMGEMAMNVPPNSIPMRGAEGPYGYIDMGGMFTVLKVRPDLTTFTDPGWYTPPAATTASRATATELTRDGIELKPKPA